MLFNFLTEHVVEELWAENGFPGFALPCPPLAETSFSPVKKKQLSIIPQSIHCFDIVCCVPGVFGVLELKRSVCQSVVPHARGGGGGGVSSGPFRGRGGVDNRAEEKQTLQEVFRGTPECI